MRIGGNYCYTRQRADMWHSLLYSMDIVKDRNSCSEKFGVATPVKLHEKGSIFSFLGLFFLSV